MKTILVLLCAFITTTLACNSDYTIKQTAYYKIDFPEHRYQLFDKPGYPYTFEYPVYGNVLQDTTFFEDKPENPYWLNIDFPQFNGKIYISYKDVRKNDFNKLVNDAFNLTYKHSTKATEILDSMMLTPNKIQGVFFKVGGNAATANQFFVTDSVNHFFEGRIVFRCNPQ